MEDGRWTYRCPICKKQVVEKYKKSFIKHGYIGASHNCPRCGGLLEIKENLSCVDFGAELQKGYAEMGVIVSKKQASNTYITVH